MLHITYIQSPIQIVETTPLNRVIDTFRALRLRFVLLYFILSFVRWFITLLEVFAV